MLSELKLVDTHAHLFHPWFCQGKEEIMEKVHFFESMRAAGIHTIIVPGYDLVTSKLAQTLAERRGVSGISRIYYSPGIHPTISKLEAWELNLQLTRLQGLIRKKRPVAIGECGLDYYRSTNFFFQKLLFRSQVILAKNYQLPLLIHLRQGGFDLDVFSDAYFLLKKINFPFGGILHCFTGSLYWARKFVKLGFLISISGNITFPRSEELKKTVIGLDWNDLVIETDSPFLSPVPLRGKKNLPWNLVFIAREIARLKNVSFDFAASRLNANSCRFLKKFC